MEYRTKIVAYMLFLLLLLPLHYSFGQSQQESKDYDDTPRKGYVYRREIDSIIHHIENTYIFGRRGISDDEWNRRVKMIYDKVDSAPSYKEYRYAVRYVGLLIEDAHFNFPENDAVYHRSFILSKQDTICPIWVKTWTDGSVYLVKDYSGRIPKDAQILSVNGHSAKDIALLNRSLGASEDRKMMEVMNNWHERVTYNWLSFTNFLFMESIKPPYTIEYIDPNTTSQQTVVLEGMVRTNIQSTYDSIVKADKKNRESISSKEQNNKTAKWGVLGYKNVGDRIGILTINSFWGGGLLELMIFGTDNLYASALKKAMSRIARDKIETLIIDISGNGGGMGDNIYKTLNYFTDKSIDVNTTYRLTDHNRKIIKINMKNADRKIMGLTKDEHKQLIRAVDSIKPNTLFCTDTIVDLHFKPTNPKNSFKGKVYLLTGPNTYSAAQIFAQHFKELGIGLTAGRPCGGYSSVSSGNGEFIELPWWNKYMNGTAFRPPFGRGGKKNKRDCFEYEPVDIFIDRPFEDWMKDENHTLDRLIEIVKQKTSK